MRAAGIKRGSRATPRQERKGWESLTAMESDVVRLTVEGLTNRQIGERLFISRRTVQTHLSHTLTKLEVSSRVELAAEAARQAPVELPPKWRKPISPDPFSWLFRTALLGLTGPAFPTDDADQRGGELRVTLTIGVDTGVGADDPGTAAAERANGSSANSSWVASDWWLGPSTRAWLAGQMKLPGPRPTKKRGGAITATRVP